MPESKPGPTARRGVNVRPVSPGSQPGRTEGGDPAGSRACLYWIGRPAGGRSRSKDGAMTDGRTTPIAGRGGRFRRLAANLALVIGAAAATLLACELLLRALGIGY